MTFPRVKPPGWAFGELFTSAQANQLDIDHANAVDGVGGGAYAGPLTFSNLVGATMAGGAKLGLSARSINRWQRMQPWFKQSEWTQTSALVVPSVIGVSSVNLKQPLELPHAGILGEIGMYVMGAGGHGAFPIGGFTLPSIQFYTYDPASGVATPLAGAGIGTQTDSSPSAAFYQGSHLIRIFPNITVDSVNKYYFLTLSSEGGTGAIAGFEYHGCYTSTSILSQDDGGS